MFPALFQRAVTDREEEGHRRKSRAGTVSQALLGVWPRGSGGLNQQQHQQQVPGTEGHLPASLLSTIIGISPQANGFPLKWHGTLSLDMSAGNGLPNTPPNLSEKKES